VRDRTRDLCRSLPCEYDDDHDSREDRDHPGQDDDCDVPARCEIHANASEHVAVRLELQDGGARECRAASLHIRHIELELDLVAEM
jgi:hypothetical protein